MIPYRPTGKSDERGILLLLLGGLLAGAAAGAAAHLVGELIRLFLIFPLGMGLLVGFVSGLIVEKKRIRAPLAAALVALLGGAAAWETDFTIGYLRTRARLQEQVRDALRSADSSKQFSTDEEAVKRVVDATLLRWSRGEEMRGVDVYANLLEQPIDSEDGTRVDPAPRMTAAQAYVAYARATARHGTRITRGTRSGGMEFGETGTVVIWFLEILLAGGVAAGMAYGAASKPFCEVCGNWYARQGVTLPIAGRKSEPEVLAAVERGDVSMLGGLLETGELKLPVVALRSRGCSSCEGQPHFLEVIRLEAGRGKAREKVLRKGLVPAEIVRSLFGEIERAAARKREDRPEGEGSGPESPAPPPGAAP